jgi:hypothetical protein
MLLKYFLVGVFCVTQPTADCVRVAGSVPYDTLQSCTLALDNFEVLMKQKDPTFSTTMTCVSAYPIPEDQASI